MAGKSQRPKGQNGVPSSLDAAIGALNRAKEAMSVTPAEAAFTSAGVLLAMIIRVGSFRFILVDCWLMYVGVAGEQSGLCRTGADLRWSL